MSCHAPEGLATVLCYVLVCPHLMFVISYIIFCCGFEQVVNARAGNDICDNFFVVTKCIFTVPVATEFLNVQILQASVNMHSCVVSM